MAVVGLDGGASPLLINVIPDAISSNRFELLELLLLPFGELLLLPFVWVNMTEPLLVPLEPFRSQPKSMVDDMSVPAPLVGEDDC